MIYEVKREVTILVEANSRDDAIKNSQDWSGETWSASTATGAKEWNSKSRFVSAKKSKKRIGDS